jgi:hypothetical protein
MQTDARFLSFAAYVSFRLSVSLSLHLSLFLLFPCVSHKHPQTHTHTGTILCPTHTLPHTRTHAGNLTNKKSIQYIITYAVESWLQGVPAKAWAHVDV